MISKLSVRALDAEICWVLKIATMHTSYRFYLNLNELFMVMFLDSDIAQNFKMIKTKVSYMIVYGIAEYFHCSLLSLLKKYSFFTPLFDKSLNYILNKDQMDIHIDFYYVDSGTISTRYLGSCFVFCPNANVLSGEIIQSKILREKGREIIMLHFSVLAVVACIRSMVPLRQA